MNESIKNYVAIWNATHGEREKLQHVYLIATVLIVLVAGVMSLFNAELGHNAVKLALLAIIVYLVNGISWNLLKSSILVKIPRPTKIK